MILQTGDPSLVTIEGPHKPTGAGGPHLDGPVPAGGNDVLLVKINYIHSRSEIIQIQITSLSADVYLKRAFPKQCSALIV